MQQDKIIMTLKEANKTVSKEYRIGKRNENGLYPVYKRDTSSHMIALIRGARCEERIAFAKTLEQAVDITKGIVEQDPSQRKENYV